MSEPRRIEPVDLYELLEISPRASQDVIQAAYRVLARKYHPDVNATVEARFRIRQLNEAYGVLSDTEGRARYDLECARARRHDRLSQPAVGPFVTALSGTERLRGPQPRLQVARRQGQERLPGLSGPAFVGLILVAACAAFLLFVLWATLDPVASENSVYAVPTIEYRGR